VAFLPNGEILITERPGTLLRIGADRKAIPISGVRHIGEGGLLGMALHPDFDKNSWIYLYLTTQVEGGLNNRVERYRLVGDNLVDREIILENIPGAQFHDGGRIAFGPDNLLYITTGDAGNPDSAQDINSLAGKVLRVHDDGAIPADNPFGNEIYSYGHRNPQGLAWDDAGRLWATEHGRSGIQSGFDELNLIEKGANYGWPVIQGDETNPGMERPEINSGPTETWAPAGLAYYDGKMFFGGLRGKSLYEAEIEGEQVKSLVSNFRGIYGRIRAVVFHNGFLYITTSNTDGRGDEWLRDDKLLRINPEIFEK
jgi:glucose/arabinose dehydrogenase